MSIPNFYSFDIVYDDDFISPDNLINTGTPVSPVDAFILSINRFGRVNLSYMAQVSGHPEEELISSLLNYNPSAFPNVDRHGHSF